MFLLVLIVVPALIALFSVIDSQLGHFLDVMPKYLSSFAKIQNFIVQLISITVHFMMATCVKRLFVPVVI